MGGRAKRGAAPWVYNKQQRLLQGKRCLASRVHVGWDGRHGVEGSREVEDQISWTVFFGVCDDHFHGIDASLRELCMGDVCGV